MDKPKFKAPKTGLKPAFNMENQRRLQSGTHLGWRWRDLRRSYLKQHPLCEKCLVHVAEQVHHIEPRAKAPHRTLDSTNLQALCTICHLDLHRGGKS